jgi:GT2 family glycosyltransferase
MSVAERPRLSVIIVTWNVREMTMACLAALTRETAEIPTEIIMVDNASADDTVATVRSAYPDIRVIANSTNVGFPAANNQALEIAQGEYILYLNPDTEVGAGAVRACIDELDSDDRIAMAGCRLVLEDGSTQLECARRPYLLRHMVMETLYLHMLFPRSRVFGDHLMSYWDHSDSRDVDAICGAFMLVRADVAVSVGGLPEDVFMYHEDVAFCLRIRKAGWRIRYRGDVSTLHRWRGSSRKSSDALALLEGVYKVQLIRESQGAIAAGVARVVFAVRCITRVAIAGTGAILPVRRLRARYPRVFDLRSNSLQLAWAVAPFTVAHRVPVARRDAALENAS